MESRVFHMKWLYHLYFYPRCHNDNAKILILTCDSRYVRNKRNDFCAFVLGMDYYISWYIWLQKYSGTWYNNSGVRDMSQTCIVVTCRGIAFVNEYLISVSFWSLLIINCDTVAKISIWLTRYSFEYLIWYWHQIFMNVWGSLFFFFFFFKYE